MRRLIVSMFITLDGVVEAPGGEPGHPHTNWAGEYMGDAEVDFKMREVKEAGALLIGRVTYESFAGAFPNSEGEIADTMNSIQKHVVSTTLRNPEWINTSVIDRDVVASIQELKQGEGGPLLVHGSRTLIQTLFANGLVDELRLMIFPVTVGSGFRLFPETPEKTIYTLIWTDRFDSGVVVQTYEAAIK